MQIKSILGLLDSNKSIFKTKKNIIAIILFLM